MKDLNEFTVKQVKSEVDSATAARSKNLKTEFVGLDKTNRMEWETLSGSNPGSGKKHKQTIELADLDVALAIDDDDFKNKDRARLALAGDIKLFCNCAAFQYWGFKYITTQVDLNTGPKENRLPKVRNPKLQGIVCKHLAQVLNVTPFFISDLTKELRGKGAFGK